MPGRQVAAGRPRLRPSTLFGRGSPKTLLGLGPTTLQQPPDRLHERLVRLRQHYMHSEAPNRLAKLPCLQAAFAPALSALGVCHAFFYAARRGKVVTTLAAPVGGASFAFLAASRANTSSYRDR